MGKHRDHADNAIEKADVAVADGLEAVIGHPVVRAIGELSEIGDQPPLYAMAGAITAVGLVMDDPRTLRAGSRMLAAHAGATILKTVFKRAVDRTRPEVMAQQDRYHRGKGRRYESDFNSFPSGHTASAIAAARAIGREYPGQHDAALVAAGAIALTQIVRGKHFVTDVVAGVALGLLAEAAVDALFRRYHPDVDSA